VKNPPLKLPSDPHTKTPPQRPLAAVSYPGVAAIEVRWQKQVLGSGWENYREPWQLVDPGTLGEYLDCADVNCFGGGCCIAAVIRDMVLMKSTQRRGRVRCKGQKGPDGKRRWRLCIAVFKYDVRLRYLEDALEQSPSVPPEIPAIPPSGVERRVS